MFYVFLMGVALIGGAAYVVLLMAIVPGFSQQRLGTLEGLPPNLGLWQVDGSPAPGDDLIREVRIVQESTNGLWRRERLVRQVRYRNRASGRIVASDPEVLVKRRRVKSRVGR